MTSWTIAQQAPLSMEFSRQEYWSGLPFPSPGDLPDPGTEPVSPKLQADSLLFEPLGKGCPQTPSAQALFSQAWQSLPQSQAGWDATEDLWGSWSQQVLNFPGNKSTYIRGKGILRGLT